MRGSSVVVLAVPLAVAALLSGCGDKTVSTSPPSSGDDTALWDPCSMPDQAVQFAGITDTASKLPNALPGGPQPGWKACRWTGSWYALTVFSTVHTVAETQQESVNHGFKQIDLAGRPAFTYTSDDGSPNCSLAAATKFGSIEIAVDQKASQAAADLCQTVVQSTLGLVPYLP